MKRDGCHHCGQAIDFAKLELLTCYPGLTPYTCPRCAHQEAVYSGVVDPNFWDRSKEAIAADDAARYAKRGKVDEDKPRHVTYRDIMKEAEDE